jgi:hypothetical protein
LGTTCRWENLGRDEPYGCEPTDAESTRCDEEDDGADDSGDEDREIEVGGVLGEAAEKCEEREAGGKYDGALDEEEAAAENVDEDPGEGHEEEVGRVVAEGEIFGSADVEAEKLNIISNLLRTLGR